MGDPTGMNLMDRVARGVLADIHDTPHGLYIPLVQAEIPGNGDVSRWLDSLPGDRRIVFPTVLSRRLEGMLARRGYALWLEWAEPFEEWAECWVRAPLTESTDTAPEGARSLEKVRT